MSPTAEPRAALTSVLRAALGAVDARGAVEREISTVAEAGTLCGHPFALEQSCVVIAIGKAAAGMTEAVAEALADRIHMGVVVTKDGHAAGHRLDGFEVYETAHPVPDARGEVAARRVLEVAGSAAADDLLLVLLSGGASALVSLPPEAVTGDELAATNALLLGCGADIAELNAVRKHLSKISGGRLAKRASAKRIAVLAISDVPEDALEVIGSGPCAPDPSRFSDAVAILEKYALLTRVPASVREYLERGVRGEFEESPKPGDPLFGRVHHRIVACNADARRAARNEARSRGARPVSLGACIQGEARQMGRRLAALAKAIHCQDTVCLVAGGESVVVLSGDGRGGRNQEVALAAAVELDGGQEPGPVVLAAGTDGSDGPTDAAGAWADGATVARAREAGFDAIRSLENNDSYPLFQAEKGLLMTGPTGTNVMDLALVWIPPQDVSQQP